MHGGPAFQGWRKGFGFGHSKGPGGSTQHPSMPQPLRFTPAGDRCFASSAFWRKKYEVGQASGFGIGDRPDYGKQNADFSVAPNNYGDVSKALHKTKRIATRPGITLKPRFPSMEEKYRDLSWPQCGPGPGKYDTATPCGADARAHSLGVKAILQGDLREQMSKPGPGGYNTACKPGTNYPIKHGTLYDINIKSRTRLPEMGAVSPGPAKYSIKGGLDEYGLLQKIQNVKGPKHGYWKASLPNRDRHSASAAHIMEEEEYGHDTQEPAARGLTRIESAP